MVDQDIEVACSQWLCQVKGYHNDGGNAAQPVQHQVMRFARKAIVVLQISARVIDE